LKKFLYIGALLVFLIACKEENQSVVFNPTNISNDYASNIEVTIDKASGDNAVNSQINNTIETALINGIPNAETATTLNDALTQFDDDYKDFKTRFDDENHVWELALETEITYQSNQVITIAISSYADTGGAHGNDSIQLLNINPETGKTYNVDAIISDKNDFETIAKSHFETHLNAKDKDISEFFFGEAFKLPENIGFSDEGLILLYNVYEIAPHNQGYTEFVIPFEDLTDVLKIN